MHTDDPLKIPRDASHDSGELPRHVDSTEPAQDNSGYFPAGYQEKAERLIQASHGAAADPLPGPLLDAFLPGPLRAAGFTLRPVVASDLAILKRLNSPILQELKNEGLDKNLPRPEVKYTDEDVWELVYLWTHPPRLSRAALAISREAYREAAMAVVDTLPMAINSDENSKQIMKAIVVNLLRAFSTKLQHQPAGSGEGGGNFPSGQQATASAGGSTT